MNADILEVFPGDAGRLFDAAEAFTEEIVQVNIKTQHTQPLLYTHLHNTTYTYRGAENDGHGNAGHETDGPICMAWNCRTKRYSINTDYIIMQCAVF